jgi:predicted ester cyclase
MSNEGPTSEDERNVATVRRFIDEVVNGGQLEAIDELWAPDLRWHGGCLGEYHGIESFKRLMAASAKGAFRGMRLTIDDVVASAGKVAVRFTNSGTQTGPFMGAPATNKHASWLGIAIYTVVDGKIADAWFGEDILGLMLQLGVVKLPTT